MKFIFQFGYYGYPTISVGTYAWPQPYSDPDGNNDAFQDTPPSQFWWCDSTGITCTGTSSGYLDNFCYQSQSAWQSGQVVVGLLYSGFDDSNASWGAGRVIAQQCGQVLLDTANAPTLGGFWGTTNQIPYMMMGTWNDYEEGSEQESGIDNCYTAVNLSLESDGHTIQWTLSPTNNPYTTTATIHHYALWTAPHGSQTMTLRKQPKNTATNFDLSTLGLAVGSYDVYVEMVGQPSMQNEMSTSVVYTQN